MARSPGNKSAAKKTAAKKKTTTVVGTNVVVTSEALEPFAKDIHTILDDMDTYNGRMRKKVKDLYGEAGDRLGIKPAALRMVIQDQRREVKRKKKISKMDTAEREQVEDIEAALGDFATTALGISVMQEVAGGA